MTIKEPGAPLSLAQVVKQNSCVFCLANKWIFVALSSDRIQAVYKQQQQQQQKDTENCLLDRNIELATFMDITINPILYMKNKKASLAF